jgi:hypothetical protein
VNNPVRLFARHKVPGVLLYRLRLATCYKTRYGPRSVGVPAEMFLNGVAPRPPALTAGRQVEKTTAHLTAITGPLLGMAMYGKRDQAVKVARVVGQINGRSWANR